MGRRWVIEICRSIYPLLTVLVGGDLNGRAGPGRPATH
jgi:hypothetical protein